MKLTIIGTLLLFLYISQQLLEFYGISLMQYSVYVIILLIFLLYYAIK